MFPPSCADKVLQHATGLRVQWVNWLIASEENRRLVQVKVILSIIKSSKDKILIQQKPNFQMFLEDTRIDTIYRDFAKTFDKVNHHILIRKIFKHKIKGILVK